MWSGEDGSLWWGMHPLALRIVVVVPRLTGVRSLRSCCRSPMQIITAVTMEHRTLSIAQHWPQGIQASWLGCAVAPLRFDTAFGLIDLPQGFHEGGPVP